MQIAVQVSNRLNFSTSSKKVYCSYVLSLCNQLEQRLTLHAKAF